MKTILLRVDSRKPDLAKIRKAAEIIRNGGLVAFPTETVYGLGADAFNEKAVLKLFRAKKRPLDNPPIVHICCLEQLQILARNIPSNAKLLTQKFWPGPLTLIFNRSKELPDVTVAGLDTVAIRMPRHRIPLILIRESKVPIAAPSANLAGRPSPTTAQHVLDDITGRIDAVLDAGSTRIGVESTVLDLTAYPPQVLRPGGITFEELKTVLGNVILNPAVFAEKNLNVEKARSPGMKHKHYAPKAEIILIEGSIQAITTKIKEVSNRYARRGLKVGILVTDETHNEYENRVVKSLGSRKDPNQMARNLFRLLREFDLEGIEVILAEGIPIEGLGLAIMNRLRRASGNRILRL